MTPSRPTAITAAAVLLIVMGSELLLLVLGLIVILFWQGDLLVGFICCAFLGVVLLTAIQLLESGIKLLRAEIEDCQKVSQLHAITLLLSLAIGMVTFCFFGILWDRLGVFAGVGVSELAFMFVVWANILEFVAITILLKSGSAAYQQWRATRRQHQSGYEYDDAVPSGQSTE